ncbi:ATP-binding protein [Streptomyces afghaniensis]|uniref:ATP-binding protein n=1 Tax=Streptomyces afghaniensis TaxID=66865 RepID=UPI002785E42B|nr:ATP-binding protein [Streptomyces afghaniensis]MDQ1017613.1 anti-sigma regulatory factor (Ser/Thr protein kinase) [Streptomyces afghaniensis]
MNARHRRTRTIDVPANADQVPLARRAVLGILHDWGVPDDSDAVHALRLIASELLTNVVLHASAATAQTGVVVELLDGAWIRMGVHDGHADCPAPADPGTEATGGRGLKIVHAVLEELNGVILTEHTADGGKTVWVEVPCTTDGQATRAVDGLVEEPGDTAGVEPVDDTAACAAMT